MLALDLLYCALPIAAILYYLITAATRASYGNRLEEAHRAGTKNLVTVQLCAMFIIGFSYGTDSITLARLISSGQVEIRQDSVSFALSSAFLWLILLLAYAEPRTSFWHPLVGCTVIYLCAELFFLFSWRLERSDRLPTSILLEIVRTFRLFVMMSLLVLLLIARVMLPRRRPYDEEALLGGNNIHSGDPVSEIADYGTITILRPDHDDLDTNEEAVLSNNGMHHGSRPFVDTVHCSHVPVIAYDEHQKPSSDSDLLVDDDMPSGIPDSGSSVEFAHPNQGPITIYNELQKPTNDGDLLGDSKMCDGDDSPKQPTHSNYRAMVVYNGVEKPNNDQRVLGDREHTELTARHHGPVTIYGSEGRESKVKDISGSNGIHCSHSSEQLESTHSYSDSCVNASGFSEPITQYYGPVTVHGSESQKPNKDERVLDNSGMHCENNSLGIFNDSNFGSPIADSFEGQRLSTPQNNRPSENNKLPSRASSADAPENRQFSYVERESHPGNHFFIPLPSKVEVPDLAQCIIDSPDFSTLCHTPAIADREGAKPLSVSRGRVQVKSVDFSYDSSKPVLRKISFRIEPKQMVALVGDTGVGKSTILKLIMRLYNPLRGAIMIDGQNIAHVTQRSLRENIGVVPQNPVLFDDTLLNNIRYANVSASEEQIHKVCEAIGLHKAFSAYRNGYQTLIGKRGIKPSAGELQLIAIARAMVKNPKIILLDEPTSNVDSSEALVEESLRKLCKGRTTFVVANQLSIAAKADKVLVINDGRVKEQGSHNSLLRKRGYYSRLWTRGIWKPDAPEFIPRVGV